LIVLIGDTNLGADFIWKLNQHYHIRLPTMRASANRNIYFIIAAAVIYNLILLFAATDKNPPTTNSENELTTSSLAE
jgi:hypothetical protein